MEQMEQPGEACLSLCRGKFLELLKEGRWEYVRRVNASGAVMIVAVTKEGELLLVEEYRVPLHARTVGLPAGISGDEGRRARCNPPGVNWKRKPDTGQTPGRIFLRGLLPQD